MYVGKASKGVMRVMDSVFRADLTTEFLTVTGGI